VVGRVAEGEGECGVWGISGSRKHMHIPHKVDNFVSLHAKHFVAATSLNFHEACGGGSGSGVGVGKCQPLFRGKVEHCGLQQWYLKKGSSRNYSTSVFIIKSI